MAEVHLDLEHQTPIDQQNTWNSCCLTLDRRATVFFSTLTISLIIIAFCITKLVMARSCEEANTWISLLTFILGIWVIQPSF